VYCKLILSMGLLLILPGCVKNSTTPAPHALEDADTAAQRASEAMKPPDDVAMSDNSGAKSAKGEEK
jgi:hypothetical protein